MEIGWDGAEKLLFVGEELSAWPPLFHYTNLAGLTGIVRSQQIRATHFTDLNDTTEVVHVRLFLREAIVELAHKLLLSAQLRRPQKPLVFEEYRQSGYKFIEGSKPMRMIAFEKVGEQRYSSLRQVAIQWADFVLDFLYSRISEEDRLAFFVTSFCSHEKNSYEYRNGLLSQWRGYGAGGGYCIVLDSKKIWDMVAEEYDAAAYLTISVDKVEYAEPDFESTRLWKQLAQAVERFVGDAIDGRLSFPSEALRLFVLRAVFLKHQAFREEQEIRLAAFPTPRSIRQGLKREQRVKPPPLKRVHFTSCVAKKRRFISLFESVKNGLPILRVIVGPSTDQQSRVLETQAICGPNIEVTASATPYVD